MHPHTLFPLTYDSLGFIRFLTKLLTEDLPRLFVRPKKIVLDFQKGKAVGPVANDFRSREMQEGNNDFVGELSVTLVDSRKLSYFFYGISYLSLSLSCFFKFIIHLGEKEEELITTIALHNWNFACNV